MGKKEIKYFFIGILTIFFIVIFVFSSCDQSQPPETPDVSTLFLPEIEEYTTKNSDNENFFHASTSVIEWSSILESDFNIVKKAFLLIIETEPKKEHQSKWVWNYKLSLDNKEYDIEFSANVMADKTVLWEMKVSDNENYQNFLWLFGSQNENASAGQWILYEKPSNNVEYLQIDWTYNFDDNTYTLKYSKIKPETQDNGSYILFGNDQDGDYDIYYDIYHSNIENYIEIDFNSVNQTGRIKDFQYFQDSLWHQWDENQNDID